jgi:BirA family biotin operon repressor/biotin-[acetyl-CoA-carboxylase] ligase
LIEVVAETGSTSADLATRIAAGESVGEGHWLVADRQTAGRGRQGRVWNDGAGNFMGSTLVRVLASDPPAPTLSLVAGVATFAAIEAAAPGISGLALKWPNDVLLTNAKLAGILLERIGDVVVVGIGVNIAQAPEVPDRLVASLTTSGHTITREAFADHLDTCWAHALQLWRAGAWEQLRSDWIARAHPFGTALKVHGPDGQALQGTFAGLDPDGALQLQLPGGTRRTIHAGEVTLVHRR